MSLRCKILVQITSQRRRRLRKNTSRIPRYVTSIWCRTKTSHWRKILCPFTFLKWRHRATWNFKSQRRSILVKVTSIRHTLDEPHFSTERDWLRLVRAAYLQRINGIFRWSTTTLIKKARCFHKGTFQTPATATSANNLQQWRISDVKYWSKVLKSVIFDLWHYSDAAFSSKSVRNFRPICGVAATSQFRRSLFVIFNLYVQL